MSLVINHNMMAMNTARNLNNTYNRLNSSVQRLSSGLRINSAADDAAGLAIRELMRADISTMQQGVRNAADAISMIQTADGGMAVIDEKLTRMKELAEQAATGTYTTLQREIINSEYQAMAAEIDRIATATNFNGVKLLDGSITNLHGGLGMKIHFGVGNSADEDYYFINTGDVRATSSSGLRIGGDAKNDIWGQGAAGAKGLAGPGCCTAGYDSLEGNAGFISGQTFAYGYNWDWMEDDDEDLLTGKYLAGRYTVGSSWSLQDLVDEVNRGTQSRVGVQIDSTALASAITSGGTVAVCVGEEAYIFGSSGVAGGKYYYPATEGGEGFKAIGTYTDSGLYNATAKIKLTEEQVDALTDAGYDVANMAGFEVITVTSSGSAVGTTSAAAIANMLQNVKNAWAALGLAGMSAIGVAADQVNTLNVACAVITSNAAGAIDEDQRTILNNQTLVVNTGIYADDNGNWTYDKDIAEAFGMKEIIYRFTNPNSTAYTVTGTYTSPWTVIVANPSVSLTAGSAYAYDAANSKLMSDAGITTPSPTSLNITYTSLISSAMAREAVVTEAQIQLNAAFGTGSKVELIATKNNGSGITAVSLTTVTANATTTNVTGPTIDGNSTVLDNQSLLVNTGVYIDANGNFTYDSDIATALGFEELTYTYTRTTAGGMAVIARRGTTTLANNGYTTGTTPTITTTLQEIADGLDDAIKGALTALQTGAGGDQVMLTEGTNTVIQQYFEQYGSDLNLNYAQGAVGGGDISVEASYDGGSTFATVTDTWFPAGGIPVNTTVSDLAGDMPQSIRTRLTGLMTTAKGLATPLAPGEIYRIAATPSAGPTDRNSLATATAAPYIIAPTQEQTVSTKGIIDSTKYAHMVATSATPLYDASGRSNFGAWALASAINHNERSEFWAMYEVVNVNDTSVEMVYIFTKKGGDYNSLTACDVGNGDLASQAGLLAVQFENLETGNRTQDGTTFSLGGQDWGKLKPVQTKAGYGNEVWNLTLNGRDVGRDRDLWIAAVTNGENEITTPGLTDGIINGLDRHSFVEIQNAADGDWAGAEVRTQSSAQEALTALNDAMERKDKVRADIGALQNRLENTITNLEIQIEALQASESRISDVDVATEMTEFVRNQVLAQAAVSMLSQANSLPQMALSLLNG